MHVFYSMQRWMNRVVFQGRVVKVKVTVGSDISVTDEAGCIHINVHESKFHEV